MNVAKIVYLDEANGEGLRTSVFVSGCNRHCPGCFNSVAWDFNYGVKFDDTLKEDIIQSLEYPECAGISILGGEPLEPENQYDVFRLLIDVKQKYPDTTVWLYSGYTFEELIDPDFPDLTEWTFFILCLVDVLVDGPFIQEKRNLMLKFRGSENQRVLNLPMSLIEMKPIFYKDYNETR